jgi:predicted nucleic acid-binding protein
MIEAVKSASVIAFDTCALIYFIEDNEAFRHLVRPIFSAISSGEKRGVSSTITLLEVLVKPLQMGKQTIAEKYRDILLSSASVILHPVDDEVAEEAAKIRADYGFKTPDAIQLAVAKLKGADLFLTNDDDLKDFDGLPVVVLKDHLSKH